MVAWTTTKENGETETEEFASDQQTHMKAMITLLLISLLSTCAAQSQVNFATNRIHGFVCEAGATVFVMSGNTVLLQLPNDRASADALAACGVSQRAFSGNWRDIADT